MSHDARLPSALSCNDAGSRQLRPTKPRSPGPGPIKKYDWKPLADKWLKDKRVLLHTDSARAHNSKTRGVLHASVVHKKCRVWVGGRWVWEQLTYVKMKKVILPNQKHLTVKVGTQVVDRAWKFIKSRLTLNQNSKVGSTALISQVRSAQFEYWNRGRDMWERTGELLSWHMSQIMTN